MSAPKGETKIVPEEAQVADEIPEISAEALEYLSKLPPPISKESYLKITESFLSQDFEAMTEHVKDGKSAFDAVNSLRTLDAKLCYILILTTQFQNDSLRHFDNILSLFRQLNIFASEERRTQLKLNVKYAEDHSMRVVEFLVSLRVAFVLNQMASIYFQRGLYPFAAQLFLRSADVTKASEEIRKEVDAMETLTDDEKFDMESKFTKFVTIHQYDGIHMAGLTYRVLAASEELYDEKQKESFLEAAVKLQNEALKLVDSIEEAEVKERAIAQANFELGVTSILLKKPEALEFLEACMAHTEDEQLIENCNFHKILHYKEQGQIEKALETYHLLKVNKSSILLSSIYMGVKDYDKAVEVIEGELKEKESLETKDLEDHSIIFQLYQQLAQILIVKKQTTEALNAAQRAEALLNGELKDKVDPTVIEKQQDIFKAIYVEQQKYGKVLSYCIHSLASPETQAKIDEATIENILPQFAIQSKKSLLFLTETVEPESASFYVFLVTPTGKLFFARSPTEMSIEGYSQKALQSLSEESKSEEAKKEADEVLTAMYKHFISPVKEHIPTDAPLSIVTHLFQIHALTIPFTALKNPETGKHLAEEFCVELVPLQFIEQIEKIQETKALPLPTLEKHEKPKVLVIAPVKNSQEVKRMTAEIAKQTDKVDVTLLAKEKKKTIMKALKSGPEVAFFLTGDNLDGSHKEPLQFGINLSRSEILIPKDDLKKNYAPVTTMPNTCLFAHVSGTFAFCQYAHYFLQSGVEHVVGLKMIVRNKLDDKILLNEDIYPRFLAAYAEHGNDTVKAYQEVMKHLIETYDRLTWSTFALVSRVNPLPRK